jgi:hypothetical protein
MCVAPQADAKEQRTVVEMAAPPPDFNTNATELRTAAEAELNKDRSLQRSKRHVVVSVSLKQTATAPMACSVNATVRDARTGAMLAIIETASRAVGSLSPELRQEMAVNAVRSAVRKVPGALLTK